MLYVMLCVKAYKLKSYWVFIARVNIEFMCSTLPSVLVIVILVYLGASEVNHSSRQYEMFKQSIIYDS